MTLTEMKKKVLGLIEELNPKSELLTSDPDIATKINDVTNQILYEMARFKKIPKYAEIEVSEGDLITFEDIEGAVGSEVYQLDKIGGIKFELKAQGTVIKALEDGKAEIECFVYPERISEKTGGSYEFEVSADVLEVMPYGIASDLLKSDISAQYGNVYAKRYEEMIQRLDYRYQTGSFYIEGGVEI